MIMTNYSKTKLTIQFRDEKQKHTWEVKVDPGESFKVPEQPDQITLRAQDG